MNGEHDQQGPITNRQIHGTATIADIGVLHSDLGGKSSDLPGVQSTKSELVIKAETARMLGLRMPAVLAIADEAIEQSYRGISAPATFETFSNVSSKVAVGGKADVPQTSRKRRS